jgi:vacuolar-type H+-ATPase subunit I/STV1
MRYKESRIQSRDKSASKKSMCADTSCSTIHDKDQLGYSQARNN